MIREFSPVFGSLTPLGNLTKAWDPFLRKMYIHIPFGIHFRGVYPLAKLKVLVPHFKVFEIENLILLINMVFYSEEFIDCLKCSILGRLEEL